MARLLTSSQALSCTKYQESCLRFVEYASRGKNKRRQTDAVENDVCLARLIAVQAHAAGHDAQYTKGLDVEPAQEARLSMLEQTE